jgi:hypothetical protein
MFRQLIKSKYHKRSTLNKSSNKNKPLPPGINNLSGIQKQSIKNNATNRDISNHMDELDVTGIKLINVFEFVD